MPNSDVHRVGMFAQLGCAVSGDVCITGMYREGGCLPNEDVLGGGMFAQFGLQGRGDVCPTGMYRGGKMLA